MINKILGWIAGAKVGKAFTKVQNFLKNKKTYMLGTVTVITGVSGMWTDLAGLANIGDLISFVRAISDNPDWKTVLAGVAMFTVKAAIKKIKEAKESGGAPE